MSIKRFFQYKRTKVGNKFAPDPWHVDARQWLVRQADGLFVGFISGLILMFFICR